MSQTHVRIYQPAKTAMSSGRGKTKKWLLEPVIDAALSPERLMGWQAGSDTRNQIQLQFDSKAAAIKYAKAKGCTYQVIEPKQRQFKAKSYAANFTKPVVS